MPTANDIQHGGDHYKKAKIQHWDFVVDYGMGYLEGCGTKYLARHPDKNGLEGVQKAEHYVQKTLEKHLQDGYQNTFMGSDIVIHHFIEGAGLDEQTASAFFTFCRWEDEEDLLAVLDHFPAIKAQYGK